MYKRQGYPAPPDESRVLQQQPARTTLDTLEPVIDIEDVLKLQKMTDEVTVDTSLLDYIIALATATRNHDDLQVGLSPRGSLALCQTARATAVLDQRDYCIPEDIVSNVIPVCSHRIISRSYMHDGDTLTTRRIMQQVLETVASPA